jgi:hypothetical protein
MVMKEMNTLELIKDSALFGGDVPNDRIEEVRTFLDNMNVDSLLDRYNGYVNMQYHECGLDKEDINDFKEFDK